MKHPTPPPAQKSFPSDRTLRVLYGPCVYAGFLLLGILALIGVLIPGLSLARRRLWVQGFARLFFKVVGLPLTVRGLERLPNGPCILVANHASYLDGVVLKAALPARFSFVIKKEMVRAPLVATLLQRIGSEFVDRTNRHAGGMDARRLIRAASSGHALVFFPEGTFTPQPGLDRFHSGAFATAVRAQVPVVPAVIRGTRQVLPCSSLLPRWHPIEVEVLEPIPSLDAHGGPVATDALRDRARERILAAIEEPDLLAAATL